MDGVFSDLGESMVRTARLAVAIHLRERFLREAARKRIEANAGEDSQPKGDNPGNHTQGGE